MGSLIRYNLMFNMIDKVGGGVADNTEVTK